MSAIPKHIFKAEDLIKAGRTTKTNIEDIKKWLTFKPNIPEMSEEQVALFLLACDNIIENTQYTIEAYFKYKAAAPELFRNRDVDSKDVQFTHSVSKYAVSPNRTKENYAVGMVALKDTYYSNFNLEQQIKVFFTLVDLILCSNPPPSGLIFILNFKGVGVMHITRIKLGVIKKLFAFLQEALPIQLKQVHILNASYIFEKMLAIVKPFMKKELFDLLVPHPSTMPMEEFFEKHVPASCIPVDFGGDLPSLEQLNQNLQNDCRQLRTFLEADEKQIELYRKKSDC